MESAKDAALLNPWYEDITNHSENFAQLKKAFESTTSFGKLEAVNVSIARRKAYIRLRYFSGDAMWMNIVSRERLAVNDYLKTIFPSIVLVAQHINSEDEDSKTRRRSFFSKAAAIGASSGVLSFNPLIAKAEEGGNGNDGSGSEMTLFKDSSVGFQIEIPSNWKQSEQKLPDRRRLLLFVNSDESVSTGSNSKGPEDLMFVAYTPVRDDFTSLSSFGTVDQVGQATILPKGQLAGQNTDNQMLMSESKKNAYYFDYTSMAPGQPKRHFRTIFTLVQGATGGAGAVLVTITAQTLESRYDAAMKSTFDDIINSYRKL